MVKIPEIYEVADFLNDYFYYPKDVPDHICEIIQRHHLEDSWQELTPHELDKLGFNSEERSIIVPAQIIFWDNMKWGKHGKHYPIT